MNERKEAVIIAAITALSAGIGAYSGRKYFGSASLGAFACGGFAAFATEALMRV